MHGLKLIESNPLMWHHFYILFQADKSAKNPPDSTLKMLLD